MKNFQDLYSYGQFKQAIVENLKFKNNPGHVTRDIGSKDYDGK